MDVFHKGVLKLCMPWKIWNIVEECEKSKWQATSEVRR
jgi:hypothetical protein